MIRPQQARFVRDIQRHIGRSFSKAWPTGRRALTLVLGSTLIGGCASNWDAHPTQGRLNEQKIVTEVDSEYARYYLARHRPDERRDPEMELAIATAYGSLTGPVPDKAALERISREYSPDFAALVLAERLRALPRNARARELFDRNLAELRGNAERAGLAGEFRVVFAPGWFYRTVPTTGADFWRQRQLLEDLGVSTHLIATGENESVEENAAVIVEKLASLSEQFPKIIVVSTSKAGPEVLLALSELHRAGRGRSVRAWVNIGGVLRGSLLADYAMNPAARVFVKAFLLGGRSMEGVESLTTERSEARARDLELPPELLVLNYIAMPLSGQVSERARQGYAMLRSHGPNDGHTLIIDEILPGSVSIVEIGLDHYYDDPAIDLKTLALTRTVIELLGKLCTIPADRVSVHKGADARRPGAAP